MWVDIATFIITAVVAVKTLFFAVDHCTKVSRWLIK